MSSYSILGLMSGTSLDGLDISYCNFSQHQKEKWEFTVNQVKTVPYPKRLLELLNISTSLSTLELLKLNKSLGVFYADCILEFINENKIIKNEIDAIASHGHTVFHQPSLGFTQQIGCGQTLSYLTGIKVINDFRQKDVCAGGQGAPLVPIGDLLLFSNMANAFLNIGGFSNICILNKPTIAYDICPGNLPLNKIALQLGKRFDSEGKFASQGNLDYELLEQLNKLEYYNRPNPKSLGTEWLEAHFLPLIEKPQSPKDLLRTLVEHIAIQITNELHRNNVSTVMITGGGAKNQFLLDRISSLFNGEIKVPSTKLVDFKEAIIFGFLGALYLAKQINCLSSVTGAKNDVIGGVLHLPQ